MPITIKVDDVEYFDNETERFIYIEGGKFTFEHSLVSLSKWEAIWRVPFLTAELSGEQLTSYLTCMCYDNDFYAHHLTSDVVRTLTEYIGTTPSATTIQNGSNNKSTSVMTSEVIYSIMVAARVPFECQHWNLNRLLILLGVISENNSEKKPMTQQEILEQNRRLNAERQEKYNTKG